MWGILTNMVTTRRSSARLQEKQSTSASVPSSPTPSATAASPTTRRVRSATKATPPSASRSTRRSPGTKGSSSGSGAKRGRPRKNASADNEGDSEAASATQSDTATDNGSAADESESTVSKQLFPDEAESAEESASAAAAADAAVASSADDTESDVDVAEKQCEATASTAALSVEESETEVRVEVAIDLAASEEEKADQEEHEEAEEEIVMMDSSDEDDEEMAEATDLVGSANQSAVADELEDDEDFDVAAFAKMAAASIDLSTTTSTKSASAASAKAGIHLVPDTLDSGASSRTKFLEFEGTKLGLGAKVVAATVSKEEEKVLAKQLGKVEKANRQRTEAQNVSTAGRKWFDMSTHEMDADARRDFALLKMRNYLDPKKFYKTSDHTKKMPKHFQFGTVIEGAHEFKSARLTKKERKQTFTEEVMADDSIRSYTKRVFLQVQNARAGGPGKKKKQKRF